MSKKYIKKSRAQALGNYYFNTVAGGWYINYFLSGKSKNTYYLSAEEQRVLIDNGYTLVPNPSKEFFRPIKNGETISYAKMKEILGRPASRIPSIA